MSRPGPTGPTVFNLIVLMPFLLLALFSIVDEIQGNDRPSPCPSHVACPTPSPTPDPTKQGSAR
jgi:hypothetical protein